MQGHVYFTLFTDRIYFHVSTYACRLMKPSEVPPIKPGNFAHLFFSSLLPRESLSLSSFFFSCEESLSKLLPSSTLLLASFLNTRPTEPLRRQASWNLGAKRRGLLAFLLSVNALLLYLSTCSACYSSAVDSWTFLDQISLSVIFTNSQARRSRALQTWRPCVHHICDGA